MTLVKRFEFQFATRKPTLGWSVSTVLYVLGGVWVCWLVPRSRLVPVIVAEVVAYIVAFVVAPALVRRGEPR